MELPMVKAYIFASCDTGSDEYVVTRLKEIEEVKEAHGIFGTYDTVAILEAEDDEKLKEVVKKIRKISKIRATFTLMISPKIKFRRELSSSEKNVLSTYMSHAYVLIHCSKNDDEKILNQLSDIPEVIQGDIVIGQYEIICKVSAPVFTSISKIITNKIRKIGNIKSTVTLNIISENK